MKKIGILGGTFDPPHIGHLVIGEQARIACSLDEVWFMPVQTPPHKLSSNLCLDQDRIEMLKRAIKTNPYFQISLIEFERNGPSYTIDTIKELRKRHENLNFYFIIGGDMINYLPNWKDIDELVTMITFIGIERPGHPLRPTNFKDQIIMVNAPKVDLSSSELREMLYNKQSVRYLLPDDVYDYIQEMGLYGKR